MDANSQRPGRQDTPLSLNAAIDAMNSAEETTSMAIFGSVSVILTTIRDSMANKTDYVEIGLVCAKVCGALDRGMSERRRSEGLGQPLRGAIEELTGIVAELEERVIKRSGENAVFRLFHAKSDKESIAAWKLDLDKILRVFSYKLIVQNRVSDMTPTYV